MLAGKNLKLSGVIGREQAWTFGRQKIQEKKTSAPFQKTSVPPEFTAVVNAGQNLSGGANMRWDVSRQIRQAVDDPKKALPSHTGPFGTYKDYPSALPNLPENNVVGNDDPHVIGENNDPYSGNTGKISSIDTPQVTISASYGKHKNIVQFRTQFLEFARLNLGGADDGRWFRISDFQTWRLHSFFIKEKEKKQDLNGDGDTKDEVWVDDGSVADLTNSDFQP